MGLEETIAFSLPLLIAVIGGVIGASLNVIRGVRASEEPFDIWAFIGAVIIGVMSTLAVISMTNIDSLTQEFIALLLFGLVTGFGSDFALSRAKTSKLKAKVK